MSRLRGGRKQPSKLLSQKVVLHTREQDPRHRPPHCSKHARGTHLQAAPVVALHDDPGLGLLLRLLLLLRRRLRLRRRLLGVQRLVV
jgi:hypothetical protein